jgi:hypothetical protein
MKRYLLLRENQETGPHSREELKEMGLVSYDLIWEEGKSLRWMYPSEIEALSDLPVSRAARKGTIKASFKKQEEVLEEAFVQEEPVAVSVSATDPYSFTQEKETYISTFQDRKFSFQTSLSKTRGLWIIGLLAILLSSAVIMKNIVDSVDENPYQEPEARVEAISYSDDYAPVTQMDPAYQNAIVTEVVAVDTTASKPVAKKPSEKSIKKQVSLKGSDYKQGVLGGISDLRLTVKNSSEYKIDRVMVQVKYLKPNGQAVKTEHYDVTSIPAGGSKVLEVPDSKRGVKVTYKLVSVEPVHQTSSVRKA